jgi:hypothetical protein
MPWEGGITNSYCKENMEKKTPACLLMRRTGQLQAYVYFEKTAFMIVQIHFGA